MDMRNPYFGPAPIAEGARLFGRDAETRDLYHLLLSERIVLLYSPPGAGKTSLIRAGLLPQLRRDPGLRVLPIDGLAHTGADVGNVIGNRYVASLVGQLELALPQALQTRFDWRAPDASLRGYLDWMRGAADDVDRGLDEVLLLDHFEDLLLDPSDRPDKQSFIRELGQALTDRRRHALFSMGEHHVAELDEYLHLVPTALAHRFRLGLLSRSQARQAIVGPAAAVQVHYEPRALAALMLKLRRSSDAGDGRRPALQEWVEPVQLQVACRRLWAARFAAQATEPHGLVRAEDVKAFSVESALGNYYADAVKAAAQAAHTPERDVRDWIEDRLILPSGARGQALRTDTEGPQLPERAADALRRSNVVRLQMLGTNRWYELSHDRLVEPIRRDNLRWFGQHLAPLQLRAREWSRARSPDGLLLSVPEFLAAWRWRHANAADLRREEQALWAQSRRSLLQTRVLPMAAALLLVIVALVGMRLLHRAEAEKSERLQQQMLVSLGRAKEMALERSLDTALIEGTRTASDVMALPAGAMRERLEFSARDSLMSVLRSSRNLRRLIVHDDMRLKAVALQPGSADGRFAYGGTGGRVMFANANGLISDAPEVTCSGQSDVRTLAFDARGTLLALGCEDGTVSVWSTAEWKRVSRWQAHAGRTVVVAFDRQGSAVASGGSGKGAGIRLMPLAEGGVAELNEPRVIGPQVGSGGIWAVAFSPTEDHLVVADGEHGLWLCNVGAGDDCERRGAEELTRADDTVTALSFSANGECIATGSWNGKVALWDRLLRSADVLSKEETPALSLVFTKRYGTVQLAVGRATRLRFVPVNLDTCGKGDTVRGSGSPVVGDEVTGLAFDDERGLLAATTAVGYFALLDIERATDPVRTAVFPMADPLASGTKHGWRGALASDAAGNSQIVVGREADDRLYVFTLAGDSSAGVVPTGQVGIERVTSSVSTQLIATLGKDGSIKFWTLAGGELAEAPGLPPLQRAWELANEAARRENLPEPFPGGEQEGRKPARILMNPAGNLLACLFKRAGQAVKGVLMVDLSDRQASRWLPTDRFGGREIAFSADGALFALGGEFDIGSLRESGAGRDRILVWEVHERQLTLQATEQPMQVTRLADAVYELALATERDGNDVVISGGANGQIQVWDASSGRPVKTLRSGSRQVTQMAFLPSKSLLAAADPFGRVTLWDTGDWLPHELATQFDPKAEPLFIGFAQSGNLLVIGSDELTRWDIDMGSLRLKACELLGARPGSTVASERVAQACGVAVARP
ncbi:MAG: hypothetical protein Q7U73_13420 [Rubrivivax sp.]|nr:hypothetical protein [Rubrivivax sp.]